ncbi:alpha-methylacyl-CoA racemase isoform X2 [Malaya genurostris]|nr:alpha-methylacyl-CoA racemase isoform X2 [Malaya genurostris]
MAIDLKKPQAIEIVRSLCRKSDVLIEPFRPGVMEKLGLGPTEIMLENPRLIYARLTGFGQNGQLALRAGHDINYLAISGVLSLLGRKTERPTAPINLIADFAGGGLLCAFGILAALLERHHSGKGQIVDHSMVEGAAYIASWLFRSQKLPIWGKPRGENLLDTGAHFYDTYETKDGKYMSVGAIEPQFYKELLNGLDLKMDLSQFEDSEKAKHLLEKVFRTKTRNEWTQIFQHRDACVFPVLDMDEAQQHPHNLERHAFLSDKATKDTEWIPSPAPKLSRTPAQSGATCEERNEIQNIREIFVENELQLSDIEELYHNKILLMATKPKL